MKICFLFCVENIASFNCFLLHCRIYYASCQDSSSRFAYTQISRHRVTCTQGRLEEGHFYAPIPEGTSDEILIEKL